MKEGPQALFMFVFGELCRYLFYFGFICFYLLLFVFRIYWFHHFRFLFVCNKSISAACFLLFCNIAEGRVIRRFIE